MSEIADQGSHLAQPSLRLRVRGRRPAADSVVLVELEHVEGHDLPGWEPGAHLEIVLPSGLVRHYSLCGDRADASHYVVAVLRVGDGRGGSIEVHDADLVGRVVEVRGPRNNFRLVDADEYLLLAGGIGVTPLLPMARELHATDKPWSMVYGGRSRSGMAFLAELVRFGSERVHIVPQDECGIPDLRSSIEAAPEGAALYCCGPEPMLAAVQAHAAELGRSADLHIERFAGTGAIAESSTSFEVELRRSNRRIAVPPDQSILDAVRSVLPHIPFSCAEGICGTCETSVLEGDIEHRDHVLSADEQAANTTMMICVSRARSAHLVLDL